MFRTSFIVSNLLIKFDKSKYFQGPYQWTNVSLFSFLGKTSKSVDDRYSKRWDDVTLSNRDDDSDENEYVEHL